VNDRQILHDERPDDQARRFEDGGSHIVTSFAVHS
jgi:hypothetical protein